MVSEAVILKGWRCPIAKLWRVPITEVVTNENTDTLLLDHPHGHDSINTMYQVETMTVTRNHIQCMGRHTVLGRQANLKELLESKELVT